MADAVDILETSRNAGSMQSAIDGWVADNGAFDRTYMFKRGSNKVLIVVEYTTS